jgi:large subunit ribosomal protein L23
MNSPVKIKGSKKADAPVIEEKKTPAVTKMLALKPRVSEKSFALSEQLNTYAFDVPSGVNKFDIATAVAAQFEVTVTGVRVAGIPGKAIKAYRQRGRRSIDSKRSDIRKAYVTLKEGDKLPIFAAVDQPEIPKETK